MAEPDAKDTKDEIIVNANGIYDMNGNPITHYYGYELYSPEDTVRFFAQFQESHPEIAEAHVKLSDNFVDYEQTGKEPSDDKPHPDALCHIVAITGHVYEQVGSMNYYYNLEHGASRCAHDCMQDLCYCPKFRGRVLNKISDQPPVTPIEAIIKDKENTVAPTEKKVCCKKFFNMIDGIRNSWFPKHRVKG